MKRDPHRQDTEWFKHGDRIEIFELDLFRAIKMIRDNGGHPVLRVSEKVFSEYLFSEITQVVAACWSVYMFRGYPVALRSNDNGWRVVEVVDENGRSSSVFTVQT